MKAERKLSRAEPYQVSQALKEHVMYNSKSTYLLEYDKKGEKNLSANQLISAYKNAQTYELNIQYTGRLNHDKVVDIISNKLTLEGVKNPKKTHYTPNQKTSK